MRVGIGAAHLVVHELIQRPDGTLAVRIPDTVKDYFATPQPVHFDKGFKTPLPQDGKIQLEGASSFRCLSAGWLPETALIEATAIFTEPTKGLGIMLRTSEDFEAGYYARVEPLRGRLVLDAWPRRGDLPYMVELERPIRVQPGKPVQVTIYIDGTLCEVYLDQQVAMSARMYNHLVGNWGLFVSEGCVLVFRCSSLNAIAINPNRISGAWSFASLREPAPRNHTREKCFTKRKIHRPGICGMCGCATTTETTTCSHCVHPDLAMPYGNNFSLAKSPDGVHWTEIGPVLTWDAGATWMGTGSIWRNPVVGAKPQFQINYSLWVGERQTIFFAQSDDLIHWTKCGKQYEFVQDERWYERNGRWDCIWTIARPEGGLYGYWTATPKPETGAQFGFGESLDGITWKALEPPRVSGVGTGEVGAIEKVGDRYVMLFGTNGHMETLVADKPQGPFTVLTRNRVVLGGTHLFRKVLSIAIRLARVPPFHRPRRAGLRWSIEGNSLRRARHTALDVVARERGTEAQSGDAHPTRGRWEQPHHDARSQV